MQLPIDVPVAPMLSRRVDLLPPSGDGFAFEPKWDGFRCIILKDGDQVELTSRMSKSLTHYFPEIVQRVRASLPERCVVDGEIILPTGPEGRQTLDWDALSQRLQPSMRRAATLARQSPAQFVCFDLLALGDEDLSGQPFHKRRARLESISSTISPAQGIRLTASTTDADLAQRWFASFGGFGLDGVMAKQVDGPYEFGRRTWLKVKQSKSAEAVVIGMRRSPRFRGVGQLLLGLYGEHGEDLQYVGMVNSLSPDQRSSFAADLAGLAIQVPDGRAPYELPSAERDLTGAITWLRPELVAEVQYDQLVGQQFRHPARFLRWRPDRAPLSCRVDQLGTSSYDLAEMVN